MAENEAEGRLTAWTCSDCAAKAGWKMPSGTVVDAIRGTCPKCGRFLWLIQEEDYRRLGRKETSQTGRSVVT